MRSGLRKLSIIFCVLFLKTFSSNNKSLAAFCIKKNIDEKTILISHDLSNCNNCITPLDVIIREIKKNNPQIKIFLISNSQPPTVSLNYYVAKLKLDTTLLKLEFNKDLYDYLIAKTDYVSNICLISKEHKILTLKNLKDDDLSSIYDEIKSEFELFITKKNPLSNRFISLSEGFDGLVVNKRNFFILKRGLNLIAKYNTPDVNTINVFLDSLSFDYLALCTFIVGEKDYLAAKNYYNKSHPKTQELINPISIFKISESEIGVNFQIKTYKDSLYKSDTALYEINYSFVGVLDTNLKMKRVLKFESAISKNIVPYAQSISFDSIYYYYRYDLSNDHYSLSTFREKDGRLKLINDMKEPRKVENNGFLPVLSNLSDSIKSVYMTYRSPSGKSATVYAYDIKQKKCTKLFALNKSVPGYFLYETPGGNCIFLSNKKNKIFIEGFNRSKQKVVSCSLGKKESGIKNKNVVFVFDESFNEFSFVE